jgi:hypothetical protein
MRACACVLIAGLAACAPRAARAPVEASPAAVAVAPALEPEPEPAPGVKALGPEFLAPGMARPPGRAIAFDVVSLPAATWGEPETDAGFVLTPQPSGYRLSVRGPVFAEVIVAAPARGVGLWFSGFTGGSFSTAESPLRCGGGFTGELVASWGGVSPGRWTDDGVDVEMGEGRFHRATCAADADEVLRGRARAIVAGYVYGLRVQHRFGADLHEDLLVVLPRGDLVAASGDPELPLNAANTGAFTRLTFPIAEGDARSACLRLSEASLALWGKLRAGRSEPRYAGSAAPSTGLLVCVEVAWQGAAPLGRASFALPPGAWAKPYAPLLAAVGRAASTL